ncbi:MAG: hypothetical protein KF823_15945 [Xanthomonadales bacterium]|nr:hypothetical protein [Xanthomonadales bacterium]
MPVIEGQTFMTRLTTPAGRAAASLLLLALAAAPAAQAAGGCDGPWPVAETSRTFIDPARNDREVPARLFHPGIAAGVGGQPVAGCAFPILAFGHGFTIPETRYRWLALALAAQGFVVALAATETGLSPSHGALADDLAFLPRALVRDPTFASVAGTPHAIGGHSMGGGAALLAVASAPRTGALFALAPAETNPSAIAAAASIRASALLVTGSRDCVTPTAQHAGPMFAALATPPDRRQLLDIAGGSHCQFSDGWFTCTLGEASCGGGATLPAAEQQGQVLQALLPLLVDRLVADALFVDDFGA